MSRRLAVMFLIVVHVVFWTPSVPAQSQAAEQRLTILLTNDDGIGAPGLRALADALAPIAHLIVAAPATEQSGTGHGITYREPIMVNRIERDGDAEWFSIAARPATCVELGLMALVTAPPDLVISGINRGENLGIVTFMSGTVGAAREASLAGIPSLAVSMRGNRPEDYQTTAEYVRRLVERLKGHNLIRPGLFLNVNVPTGADQAIKGTRITKTSLKAPRNAYEKRTSPRGQVYYWNTYEPVTEDEKGTDVHAFRDGYVAITPMSIDQTKASDLATLQVLADAKAAAQSRSSQ